MNDIWYRGRATGSYDFFRLLENLKTDNAKLKSWKLSIKFLSSVVPPPHCLWVLAKYIKSSSWIHSKNRLNMSYSIKNIQNYKIDEKPNRSKSPTIWWCSSCAFLELFCLQFVRRPRWSLKSIILILKVWKIFLMHLAKVNTF